MLPTFFILMTIPNRCYYFYFRVEKTISMRWKTLLKFTEVINGWVFELKDIWLMILQFFCTAVEFYSFIYSFTKSLWRLHSRSWPKCWEWRDKTYSLLISSSQSTKRRQTCKFERQQYKNLRYSYGKAWQMWEKEILWCRVGQLHSASWQHSHRIPCDWCPMEGQGTNQ